MSEPIAVGEPTAVAAQSAAPLDANKSQTPVDLPRTFAYSTFWEFAVAVNRSEPTALAVASNGARSDISIDGAELKKLLGMMWFRTVLARLSADWRSRLLEVLVDSVSVPDHVVKLGRQAVHLRELSYAQLQEIGSKTFVHDSVRPDLDLLITVGKFWGADALKRFRFTEAAERHESSRIETLLQRFRD